MAKEEIKKFLSLVPSTYPCVIYCFCYSLVSFDGKTAEPARNIYDYLSKNSALLYNLLKNEAFFSEVENGFL